MMRRANRERADDVPARKLHRRRSANGDDGFSIIEVVACIVLMGIVMAPVMYAVIATVRASSNSRQLAQVETVLQNAADRVNRAPKACDYEVYVQAAARTVGWDSAQATVNSFHYVPAATPAQPGQWVSGACSGSSPSELLVQMISITVTSPVGNITKRIEVVKSNV